MCDMMTGRTDSDQHPSIMQGIRAKQNIVFCVLTLLFNLIAVALVAASPPLRNSSKFHIITSMSVASILACLVYFPLDTQEALASEQPVHPDPTTRILLHGLHSYCVPSIHPLSLAFLGLDYMINKIYHVSTQRKIIISVTGISIPWTFGFMSLFPYTSMHLSLAKGSTNLTKPIGEAQIPLHINVSDIYHRSNMSQLTRQTVSSETATVPVSLVLSLVLLWGILPLTLAFVTTVSSTVLRIFQSKTTVYLAAPKDGSLSMPIDSEDGLGRRITLLDTVVSTIVILILNIPFLVEVISGLSCSPYGQCSVTTPSSRNTVLARWSVYFILPALWMFDENFREACTVVLGKLCLGSCVVYY